MPSPRSPVLSFPPPPSAAASSTAAWRAGARRGARRAYWAGAVRRGATPLDVAADGSRWWTETTTRRRPDGPPPPRGHREPDRAPARLHAGPADGVVPDAGLPAAGRPRLLHRRLQRRAEPDQDDPRRRARPASTRWTGWAPRGHARTRGSSDYLDFIGEAIDHIGAPVNLIGDCQGGWLAAIYAALHPEQVNTLTLAGRADRLPRRRRRSSATGCDCFDAAATTSGSTAGWSQPGGGVLKGELMLDGFIAHQARERDLPSSSQLLAHLRDERAARALPRLRGLVQAHPGHPGRLLPVDRRAPVPRQRAGRAARSRSAASAWTWGGSRAR